MASPQQSARTVARRISLDWEADGEGAGWGVNLTGNSGGRTVNFRRRIMWKSSNDWRPCVVSEAPDVQWFSPYPATSCFCTYSSIKGVIQVSSDELARSLAACVRCGEVGCTRRWCAVIPVDEWHIERGQVCCAGSKPADVLCRQAAPSSRQQAPHRGAGRGGDGGKGSNKSVVVRRGSMWVTRCDHEH